MKRGRLSQSETREIGQNDVDSGSTKTVAERNRKHAEKSRRRERLVIEWRRLRQKRGNAVTAWWRETRGDQTMANIPMCTVLVYGSSSKVRPQKLCGPDVSKQHAYFKLPELRFGNSIYNMGQER